MAKIKTKKAKSYLSEAIRSFATITPVPSDHYDVESINLAKPLININFDLNNAFGFNAPLQLPDMLNEVFSRVAAFQEALSFVFSWVEACHEELSTVLSQVWASKEALSILLLSTGSVSGGAP